MAAELGLDIRLARRGGLMHAIGKSLSHEVEGPHAMIGADVAKKYGESPKVVNAIAAHHEQVDPICPESVLVAAAEALSASRPGARRETLEAYVKRLEKLEKIAQIAREMDKALTLGQMKKVTALFDQEWKARKALAPTISTPHMNKLITGAKNKGAQAAKVCGAGGGGCIAFMVPSTKRESVVSELVRLNGQVIPFRFVQRGLRVQTI